MIDLYQSSERVHIDTRMSSVSLIYISYRGIIDGTSMLPEGWEIYTNKKAILCVATTKIVPTNLFTYIGKVDIKGGYVVYPDSSKENLRINVLGIDKWQKIKEIFSDSTSMYEELVRSHGKASITQTDIITENLETDERGLIGANRKKYLGKYHKHSNGQIMSGSFFSRESRLLFNPDSKEIKSKTRYKKVIKRKPPRTRDHVLLNAGKIMNLEAKKNPSGFFQSIFNTKSVLKSNLSRVNKGKKGKV